MSHAENSSVRVMLKLCVPLQHFITLLDALKLNLNAVDQLHPLLSDLMQSLALLKILPANYEGKVRILDW